MRAKYTLKNTWRRTCHQESTLSKVKKCYAIEFYKKGRKDAMRMLIFTYEEVSIETILGKVSRHIRFE